MEEGGAGGFNSSMMGAFAGKYAGELSNRFVGQGSAYFSGVISRLKVYFDVSNSYVLNKFKIVLLPYPHKNWERSRGHDDGKSGVNYAPPREDINAPDLYIPMMTFVTYILFISFLKGRDGQFHPELLGSIFSTGIAVLMLELLVFKLGFYFFALSHSISVLELIAYCGYKYIYVLLNMIVGLVLGGSGYYLAAIANGVSAGVFMIRALHRVVGSESVAGFDDSHRLARYFLVLMAGLQLPISLFLGYRSLLRDAALPSTVAASIAAGASGADAAVTAGSTA